MVLFYKLTEHMRIGVLSRPSTSSLRDVTQENSEFKDSTSRDIQMVEGTLVAQVMPVNLPVYNFHVKLQKDLVGTNSVLTEITGPLRVLKLLVFPSTVKIQVI